MSTIDVALSICWPACGLVVHNRNWKSTEQLLQDKRKEKGKRLLITGRNERKENIAVRRDFKYDGVTMLLVVDSSSESAYIIR